MTLSVAHIRQDRWSHKIVIMEEKLGKTYPELRCMSPLTQTKTLTQCDPGYYQTLTFSFVALVPHFHQFLLKIG